MIRFISLAALVIAVSLTSHAATTVTLYGNVGSAYFAFPIQRSDLESSAPWNPETTPNPPLAPADALRAAKAALTKLDASNRWQIESVSLHPWSLNPTRWYYVVNFLVDPASVENGKEVPGLSIPVLFSGATINPRVGRSLEEVKRPASVGPPNSR